MKLSLPSHLPLRYVASFSAAMLALEVAEGTPVTIALSAQAFVVVAAIAFNVAGGLSYPSGAFVCFNALQSLIIGLLVKTVLGEPLNTNLLAPQRSMLVYLAGMVSVLVAVFFCSRLRGKRGLLENVDAGQHVEQVGLGCILIAYFVPFLLPASVQGTFAQFNSAFVYLAILLPVYQRTKQTNGKSSFHYVAFIAWSSLTYFYGFAGSSKQGLFAPAAAWIVAAVAAGYRAPLRRLVLVAAAGMAAVTLLTPFSQLARNYRGDVNEAQLAWQLIEHPIETRQRYNEELKLSYAQGYGYHWFDEPQGLVDRLTMLPVDDALIWSTDNKRSGSPYALWSYVLNMVPRYLYPNKPTLSWGNVYAHDIGLVAEGDETTGISFTPYADGYHTAGWLGVTLVLGLMVFCMCFVCDSVAGSIATTQWGLVYVLYFTHAAAEGMLGMTTYTISATTPALIAGALICTYIAPVLGNILTFRRAPLRA